MGKSSRIVIVGAGIAGFTTAEALRNEGFGGQITLIGAESYPPYQRPPLSKQVFSGEWPPSSTHLLSGEELERLDLRLMLGRAATGLDVGGHVVVMADERAPYDTCIIATGVRANRLEGVPDLAGVHTLRTIDDVIRVRAELSAARRLVVVGSGVLGAEIASAGRKLGLVVTLVGRTRALRLGQVGDRLSSHLEALQLENGVDLRLGVTVTGLAGQQRVESVVLSDGSVLPADLVIVAIGGRPETGWLVGSGLELVDGAVCDHTGCAAPDVYAVGDVARWRTPAGELDSRTEHHLNAMEQALAVAHLLATGDTSPAVIPFFWSEVHGTRIQAYGRFLDDVALEIIEGDPASHRFVAASRLGDRVVGVVGWNMPREFRNARALVDRQAEAVKEGGSL